jgi:hypothetical protein
LTIDVVLPSIPELHDYIMDKKIINYLWQFLNRTVEWGGLYPEIKEGFHGAHRFLRFWELFTFQVLTL